MNPNRTAKASLIDFLYVVFKRKLQILLFFVITVCIVGIATFLIKPVYEATSQILVKIGRENLYIPTLVASSTSNPVINLNNEEQINSEIEILRGRSLAERVVVSLGPKKIYEELDDATDAGSLGKSDVIQAQELVTEKAVVKLQEALNVEGIRKSNVIKVSFKHNDPQMAATALNQLVNFYFDRHLQVHKSPQSYNFFQEQSQVLADKLRQAERKLESFKKQHNVTSLEEEKKLLLEREAELRADLNQTAGQVAETENRVIHLRKQLGLMPRTIPQGEEVDHNAFLISMLETKLAELELKEKELLVKYTDKSRLVHSVMEEIQIVRNKLAEKENKRYGKSRSGLSATYQRLEESLFENEAELKALMAKREVQNAQLAEYDRDLRKCNQIEVELNQLQYEVEVDQQNFRLYLSKFEESRISNAMDTEKISNTTLIEPARAPLKPIRPKKKLNILLAVFLGVFGGLGMAFFREYLDDSLEKPADAENALGLPVLGSIPDFKN